MTSDRHGGLSLQTLSLIGSMRRITKSGLFQQTFFGEASARISAHLRLPPSMGVRQNLPRAAQRRRSYGNGSCEKGKAAAGPSSRKTGRLRSAGMPAPGGRDKPSRIGQVLSFAPGIGRDGRAGNSDKIPNNSRNIDKFTGFFDKKRKREIIATHCNKMIYFIYLSGGDSNMATKFFRGAHLPAFARICSRTANPPFSVGFDPRICPQLPAGRPGGPPRRGEDPERAYSPPLKLGDSTAPRGSDSIIPPHIRTLLPHGRDLYVIRVYFTGLLL